MTPLLQGRPTFPQGIKTCLACRFSRKSGEATFSTVKTLLVKRSVLIFCQRSGTPADRPARPPGMPESPRDQKPPPPSKKGPIPPTPGRRPAAEGRSAARSGWRDAPQPEEQVGPGGDGQSGEAVVGVAGQKPPEGPGDRRAQPQPVDQIKHPCSGTQSAVQHQTAASHRKERISAAAMMPNITAPTVAPKVIGSLAGVGRDCLGTWGEAIRSSTELPSLSR